MEKCPKKINPDTGGCIFSYRETVNYRYEYNSRCYQNCPEGTYEICHDLSEREPTTIIIPPTTVIIPSTIVILPPTTVITLPTTIIIPPTTIPLNQLTTIVDKIELSTISINEKIINELTNQIVTTNFIEKNIDQNNPNLISTSLLIPQNPNCNYENYISNKCTFPKSNINIDTIDSYIKVIINSFPPIGGRPIIESDGNTTIEVTTTENEKNCLDSQN